MKQILSQINDVIESLEDKGHIVEAAKLDNMFVRMAQQRDPFLLPGEQEFRGQVTVRGRFPARGISDKNWNTLLAENISPKNTGERVMALQLVMGKVFGIPELSLDNVLKANGYWGKSSETTWQTIVPKANAGQIQAMISQFPGARKLINGYLTKKQKQK